MNIEIGRVVTHEKDLVKRNFTSRKEYDRYDFNLTFSSSSKCILMNDSTNVMSEGRLRIAIPEFLLKV